MTCLVLALTLLGAWTESFETQAFFPPDDWVVVNQDALDGRWFRTELEGHAGSRSASCIAEHHLFPVDIRDWLVTPRVLPQSSDTSLSFAVRTTDGEACTLDVVYSERCSLPGFQVLQSFAVADTAWATQTLSLAAQSGTPMYLGFRVRHIPPDGQLWLDDVTLPNVTTQPRLCNGRLRVRALEDDTIRTHPYLQTWGSHYEMGFAHGFLLADDAMASLTGMLVGNSTWHAFSPARWENVVLACYRDKFTAPQEYLDEAQGLYDGMVAKGVDLAHPSLGRDITDEDILCFNALGDFNDLGCSSVSGWGESTIGDDTLAGGLVLARNLDFTPGLYSTLGNVTVTAAHTSSDPDEQPFFNCTMAGYFAFLSGVNQHGVGLAMDLCYHNDTAGIEPQSLVPFCLSVRHGVETRDPDQNGVNDIFDIAGVMCCTTSLRSWGAHLFSPYDSTHPTPAAVLELNNLGDSLRYARDNGLSPLPIDSDWNLALTNHERVLYPPGWCYRYLQMAESLNASIALTTERAVTIMRSTNQGQYTVQQTVFRPNVLRDQPDWPCYGVSVIRRTRPAHEEPKFYFSWNELFEGIPGIGEEHPSARVERTLLATAIVRGMLELKGSDGTALLDISGRRVADLVPGPNDIRHVSPGVYFIHQPTSDSRRLTEVRKIIITR